MNSDRRRIIDTRDARQRMAAVREIMSAPDGYYTFEWTRRRAQRSLKQNAYYHGVVIPAVCDGLAEAWGERKSPAWVHDWLKRKFLTEPVVNTRTGEVMDQATGSSAALNTEQFTTYIENIRTFAAEMLGVEIPQPVAAEMVTS